MARSWVWTLHMSDMCAELNRSIRKKSDHAVIRVAVPLQAVLFQRFLISLVARRPYSLRSRVNLFLKSYLHRAWYEIFIRNILSFILIYT